MGLWSLIVEAAWNFQKILAIHSSQHLIQTAELVLKSFQDCRGGLHPVGPPKTHQQGEIFDRQIKEPPVLTPPIKYNMDPPKNVLDTDLPAASGGFRRHLFCSLVRFQWDNFFPLTMSQLRTWILELETCYCPALSIRGRWDVLWTKSQLVAANMEISTWFEQKTGGVHQQDWRWIFLDTSQY